jgi:CRP/FNR family cyclic AMP-dependent transcriptional regulator
MAVNLKNFALFEGLQDAELRALAERAVTRAFPKQAIIINEGDIGDSLFLIVSGRVKIYLSDEHGKELILAIKGAGQYFGEMALDENLRSASVMTLEPSQFAVIPRADFKTFVLQHAEIALRLFQNLARVARGMNENVRSLAMMDVYGRVARMLLELAVEKDGKMVIPERLTQKDIASRVGASREMINRILRDLTVGGYVSVNSGRITINRAPPPRW